jgi:hypothetical protein
MTVSRPLISRPLEARSVAKRNDALPSRKASTLAIRYELVSKSNSGIIWSTYLLLTHATMQFGSFKTRESKDHSRSVSLLLLTEEDNYSISVDVRTKA